MTLEPPRDRAPARAVETLGAERGADALEDHAAGFVGSRHRAFSRRALA